MEKTRHLELNLPTDGPKDDSRSTEVDALRSVRSYLQNAPVSDDVLLPSRYTIDPETGMIETFTDGAKTPSPLMEPVFVKRELQYGTNERYLDLAALVKGSWQSFSVPAAEMASKRGLVTSLAAHGITVDDANARRVLDFFRDYRRVNQKVIPTVPIYSRTGWLNTSEAPAFALGTQIIGPGAGNYEVQAASDGEQQVLESFGQAGSWDLWWQVCRRVPDKAPAWIILYSAVVPVLMKLLDKETVILTEIVADTSTGKTTAMIWAASLFGFPGGPGLNGLIGGWRQTDVALERRATLTPDLPVFLDELSAGDTSRLEAVAYQLSTGQGKARGSLKGLQRTKSYSGTICSNGETSIASCTKKGGISARLISISELPFGDGNQAELVQEIKRVCSRNYGHAGRKIVEYLTRLPQEDVARLGERLAELEREFRQGVTNRVAGRAANNFALVALAGELFHHVCGIHGDAVLRTKEIWQLMSKHYAEEVPLHLRVREFIQNWYQSNKSMFLSQDEATSSSATHTDCWGYVKSEPDGTYLVVPRVNLDRELKTNGFSASTAMSTMKREGYLACEDGKLTARRRMLNVSRVPCYIVRIDDSDAIPEQTA